MSATPPFHRGPSGGTLDAGGVWRTGLGLLLLTVAACGLDYPEPLSPTSFTVKITNVSTSSTLDTSQGPRPIPLSPGVWMVHSAPSPLFSPGQLDRGQGLLSLAEDGDPSALVPVMPGLVGELSSGTFDTPDGASAPGPLGPGQSYTFSVEARPGTMLTVATMFEPSNDLFYAPAGGGLALFDGLTPISGDVTAQLALFDCGTEVNQEPGVGDAIETLQPSPGTGQKEREPVEPIGQVGDGFSYPAVASVIQVTVTPQ